MLKIPSISNKTSTYEIPVRARHVWGKGKKRGEGNVFKRMQRIVLLDAVIVQELSLPVEIWLLSVEFEKKTTSVPPG